MINKTAKELAQLIGGELIGDESVLITGVGSIENAKKGDIAFADSQKHAQFIEKTNASCVITAKDVKKTSKTIIRSESPALAFTKVLALVQGAQTRHPRGIHPTAAVDESAVFEKGVSVGAYSVISEGVEIGAGSVIYPGCLIGSDVKIGSSCVLYPGVILRERVIIGNNVIINSGSILGTDGFGYRQKDGKHVKIPQVGTVVIEDDVEIGSCVAIDRATLGETIVGRGTKIDNLVQIAHNVKIGENCIIVAQVGISGSTTVGRNVTVAGQVGIVDHVTVGDGSMITAQSGVTKSFSPGSVVMGTPARPYKEARKLLASTGRLPYLSKRVLALEKKVEELQKKVEGTGRLNRTCKNNGP